MADVLGAEHVTTLASDAFAIVSSALMTDRLKVSIAIEYRYVAGYQ